MKGLPVSRPAAGVIRIISAWAAATGHRILLTDVRSVDWQALTFSGERHRITLVLEGPSPEVAARELVTFLPEAEFFVAGHIVADIAATLGGQDETSSVSVAIEALTIVE